MKLTLKKLQAACSDIQDEILELGLPRAVEQTQVLLVPGFDINRALCYQNSNGTNEIHIPELFDVISCGLFPIRALFSLGSDAEDLRDILRHEFGHAIVNTYGLDWNSFPVLGSPPYATSYCKTNWEEDFCECLMLMLRGDEYAISPAKLKCIRSTLHQIPKKER